MQHICIWRCLNSECLCVGAVFRGRAGQREESLRSDLFYTQLRFTEGFCLSRDMKELILQPDTALFHGPWPEKEPFSLGRLVHTELTESPCCTASLLCESNRGARDTAVETAALRAESSRERTNGSPSLGLKAAASHAGRTHVALELICGLCFQLTFFKGKTRWRSIKKKNVKSRRKSKERRRKRKKEN